MRLTGALYLSRVSWQGLNDLGPIPSLEYTNDAAFQKARISNSKNLFLNPHEFVYGVSGYEKDFETVEDEEENANLEVNLQRRWALDEEGGAEVQTV